MAEKQVLIENENSLVEVSDGRKDITVISKEEEALIENISSAKNDDELTQCLNAFNFYIKKNNAVGIIKNTQTLSLLNEIAQARALSGGVEDKDVIGYIKVMKDQIDQGKQSIGDINTPVPTIQINQQNNTINLSDESKEKIIEVSKTLLNLIKKDEESKKEIIVEDGDGEH